MNIKLIILGFLALSFLKLEAQNKPAGKDKLLTLLYYIENYYVEEISEEELVEDAVKKILKDLDPHSVYIPKKDVQRTNEPLKGNFEGVGIQFNILNDTILVVATISGGPSEKVGLMAGDKIINIDKETVAGNGINNKGVADRLRGKKGTEVLVEVKRAGVKRLLEFKITRDKIPIFSIDASYMANSNTGYIKISNFGSKTHQEFTAALEELKAEGMQNLILDLQGNGGGYLKAAQKIADEFLESNQMIVYTEGVHSPKQELRASSYGNWKTGNVIVLVDQSSASASEIVSGALQDWDRGLVLGRRTFGKGLVQRPFTLPDTSQIRLTIAEYFTPSGRFIQKSYANGTDAYRKELKERYDSGELTDSMKMEFPDSLKFQTSGGRTVYGGGGITPDIYVPIDTTGTSEYFWKVLRKGIVNKFTLNYVDRNRKQLEKIYKDISFFDANFEIDEDYLKDFIKYAEKEKVALDEKGLEKSKEVLSVRLKALVARNLFNEEAYYIVMNKSLNKSFNKAVEIFEKNEYQNYIK
ncbi:MAG: S41 family peptidase [Chitinophagales bacterium]